MSMRSTPKRLALILALGIAAPHCGDEDNYELSCVPTNPRVGEQVSLTLQYDIGSQSQPFEFSDALGIGTFGQASVAPPAAAGTLMNGFTALSAGETNIEVRRDGQLVASCLVRVQQVQTFEVSVRVTGNGAVDLNGTACRTACQSDIGEGEMIELVATADDGWLFDNWQGDCADAVGTTAMLTVDGPKSCDAEFVEDTSAGPNQVVVPAGTYTRGCTRMTCPASETPARRITLSEFAIDRTEVTVAEYRACVDASACTEPSQEAGCNFFDSTRNMHPVNCVNWTQADDYCRFVNSRLPTEAEWEMAARGTADERLYPWGDTDGCMFANYFSTSELRACVGDTSPVGSFAMGTAQSGAVDMAGNVFEWVEDWFVTDYYMNSDLMDPAPPPQGNSTRRVRRGGSFTATAEQAFVFTRAPADPILSNPETGFRCAR